MAFDFLVLFGIFSVIAGCASFGVAYKFIRDARVDLAVHAAQSFASLKADTLARASAELEAMQSRAAAEISETRRTAVEAASETRLEVSQFMESKLGDVIENAVAKALRSTILATRPASQVEISDAIRRSASCLACNRIVSRESSDTCATCRATLRLKLP
ncbi:MAG: hypothetical protein ACRDHZ_05445 [Ktedonobacteraceae bacterium]